jgi:hypothetical protein
MPRQAVLAAARIEAVFRGLRLQRQSGAHDDRADAGGRAAEHNGAARLHQRQQFRHPDGRAQRAAELSRRRAVSGRCDRAGAGFPWLNSAALNSTLINIDARHEFAKATCNGCHTIETSTSFVHIANRDPGEEPVLSDFLTGADMPKMEPQWATSPWRRCSCRICRRRSCTEITRADSVVRPGAHNPRRP